MNADAARAELAAAGFDLVHPFDAPACAVELGLPLLSDDARPAGFIVGNTRALWPRFLAARSADSELAASPDPIEHYTEACVSRAVAGTGATVLYPHRRYDGAFLPFQRIAAAAGLGALAPTRLLVHPVYGPWFALRAVVLVPGRASGVRPIAQPCRCSAACTTAFAAAQTAEGPQAWRAWRAVRDACHVGREHRYDEAQIAYHYTKDPQFLRP